MKVLISQSGSAMTMAIVMMSVVGALTVAGLNLSQDLSKRGQRAQAKADVDSLTQLIETLTADHNGCFDNNAQTSGMTGLMFVNPTSGTKGKDQYALSSTVAEQDVTIASNIGSAAPLELHGALTGTASGLFVPSLNLTIDRLFIRNPVPLSGGKIQVELVHQSTAGGTKFAPRVVGDIVLSMSGSPLALTDCVLKQSARSMCEEMGCRFNEVASQRKCACGLPAMKCDQTAGQPMRYIAGVNTDDPQHPTALCQDFKVSCIDQKGPGFVLSGVDENGDPICQPLEGSIAPTVLPSPGTCGAASGGSFADASAASAAQLCGSGTASAVSTSGSGFSWTCTGTDAIPHSCSANQTVAAPGCTSTAPSPNPERRVCCGDNTWSTPTPPTPGYSAFQFCSCGNAPEWTPIMSASGISMLPGC